MKGTLEDLWHGNISPQTDSRNNTPKMKQLMDDYSEFLSNTAATYRTTQEEIAAKAKTLRTDA